MYKIYLQTLFPSIFVGIGLIKVISLFFEHDPLQSVNIWLGLVIGFLGWILETKFLIIQSSGVYET